MSRFGVVLFARFYYRFRHVGSSIGWTSTRVARCNVVVPFARVARIVARCYCDTLFPPFATHWIGRMCLGLLLVVGRMVASCLLVPQYLELFDSPHPPRDGSCVAYRMPPIDRRSWNQFLRFDRNFVRVLVASLHTRRFGLYLGFPHCIVCVAVHGQFHARIW